MNKVNQDAGSNTEKNENEIQSRDTVGLTQKQIIVKRFVKHKAAMGSLFGLIFIFIFVFTATGLQFGNSQNPTTVPGWWKYKITDIDPEGAIAASCNGGVTGCPTLDIVPSFFDGDGIKIGEHPFGKPPLVQQCAASEDDGSLHVVAARR